MANIINVTTGVAGTAGSTAATLINELRGDMLAVAEYDDMLETSLFVRDPIEGKAKTKQWNRLERLPVAATPAQLAEGVAADAVAQTVNSITATVEEYGNAVIISNLAVMTSRSPLVQATIRNLGYNLKETRDHLVYGIANAATNVVRINDRANDNAMAVGDYVSYEEVVGFRSTLRAAGAAPWDDGFYRAVLPVNVSGKLLTDPNWLAGHQFNKPDMIERGYIGDLANIHIIETNSTGFLATASATAGNSSKIRSGFIAGKDWAKVTDLESMTLRIQAPGQGTDYQERRYEFAWCGSFKSAIVNQTFGIKLRASSDDAVAV